MDENKKKMLQALRDQGMYYPEDTALEAGTVGLVQGATQGFGDELGATVGALGQVAQGAPASEIGGLYGDNRDAIRKRLTEIKEASPTVYNIGESTGAVGSMAVPGAAGLKALGAGAKGAALMGGLSGLGRSEADLTKGEIGQAAADTALAAASGAGGRFANTLNAVRNMAGKKEEIFKPGTKDFGRSGAKSTSTNVMESAPLPKSVNEGKTLEQLKEKQARIVNESPDILRNQTLKKDDKRFQQVRKTIEREKKDLEEKIAEKEAELAKTTTFVK